PKAAEQSHGVFSGTIEVRVPASKLRDSAAWQATGNLIARRLEVYGLALENAEVSLLLHQGSASIQVVRGSMAESPVTGSAALRLVDPSPFPGKLSLQKADLAALQPLTRELRPPVSIRGQSEVTADVKGTLSPLAFHASGRGTVNDLAVDKLTISALRFRWQA